MSVKLGDNFCDFLNQTNMDDWPICNINWAIMSLNLSTCTNTNVIRYQVFKRLD